MSTIQRSIIAALSLCATFAAPNIASAVAISGQGTWETTLQGRDLDGNLATAEAYYDTLLNITWLADANFSGTAMDWSTANAWAASLNPYGSGITGWRLPVTVQPDASCDLQFDMSSGSNCTGSEMGNLFYNVLGNTAGPLTNTGPFGNVESYDYWSVTEYADFTSSAWFFSLYDGYQDSGIKTLSNFAWAVHAGDVGTSAVPMPAAAWLFANGLLGLVGIAKRKRVT